MAKVVIDIGDCGDVIEIRSKGVKLAEVVPFTGYHRMAHGIAIKTQKTDELDVREDEECLSIGTLDICTYIGVKKE